MADNSTYGNIDEIVTDHLLLSVTVNFDNESFVGHVEHKMVVMQEDVKMVVLDYVGLYIHSVEVTD
jgi:hypothetical protein